MLEGALAGQTGHAEEWAIELLGRIDPSRALEVAANAKPTKPERRDYLKARVAHHLLGASPDEALAIIGAAADPWIRADGYLQASDMLAGSERVHQGRERLEQALLHARSVENPAHRLIFHGKIAGKLLALGETARATELFTEGQMISGEMPVASEGGFARSTFAEELAELDLAAALALIEDLGNEGDQEGQFDRHHGNIAQRLATRNPAEAERIWGMLTGPVMRDGIAQRIGYRMASNDRERACRIVRQIGDPCWRAYGLGMMGLALGASDRHAAAMLLDEAMMSLSAMEGSGDEKGAYAEPAVTAAILLPAAEAIDPGRVSETLWRALSLRRPMCDVEYEEVRRLGAEAVTAMMVARYDRAIAEALLGPILDRLPRLIAGGVTYFPEPLFVAPTVVDPWRAVALVQGLPEDSDPRNSSSWVEQRRRVAEMLALHGADRWRRAIQHAGFWDVDEERLIGATPRNGENCTLPRKTHTKRAHTRTRIVGIVRHLRELSHTHLSGSTIASHRASISIRSDFFRPRKRAEFRVPGPRGHQVARQPLHTKHPAQEPHCNAWTGQLRLTVSNGPEPAHPSWTGSDSVDGFKRPRARASFNLKTAYRI